MGLRVALERSYWVRNNPCDQEAEGRTLGWGFAARYGPSLKPQLALDLLEPVQPLEVDLSSCTFSPCFESDYTILIVCSCCIDRFLLPVNRCYMHVVLAEPATHRILQ